MLASSTTRCSSRRSIRHTLARASASRTSALRSPGRVVQDGAGRVRSVGLRKGLAKLFDTGNVPNPAFVDPLGRKLPPATVEKVSSAVLGYGGGGAIASWQKGDGGNYRALAGRLGKVTKSGALVAPELVRIDAKDVLSEPATLKDTAAADVRHHFLRSPGARME